MKKISKCRICGNKKFDLIMSLGNLYFTGRFPKKFQKVPKAILTLIKCKKCDLVQLQHNFDMRQMYGSFYGYQSSLNSWMVNHLKKNVQDLKKYLSSKDIVIDIGSNDATTLNFFEKKFRKYGFDPSAKKFLKNYKDNSKLICDFFNFKSIKKLKLANKVKLITSFAMFYDLENPIAFAKNIEKTLGKDGIWCLEQSYLPSMLKTNAFDTICHEHLEYYSLKQIENIMSKSGLKVFDVSLNKANGGSFNCKVCKKKSSYKVKKSVFNLRKYEKNFFSEKNIYKKFVKRVNKINIDLIKVIKKFIKSGKKIYIIGASTKGNVLLQYFGINSKYITGIGEVNKEKYNHFTPGTNIKILPEKKVLSDNKGVYLILPWHFKDNFLKNKKFNNKIKIFPLPRIHVIK